MAKTTPMVRTKAVLREQGIVHGVVERYHPKSTKHPFGCKQDFLNIIDLIALDNGVVGIQVCGTDLSEHKEKLLETEKLNTIEWVRQQGARLEVWAWRQLKKVKGKKAMIWKPRIIDILLVNGELYWEERAE